MAGLSVDRSKRRLTAQYGLDIREGDRRHLAACRRGRAAQMRQQHGAGRGQEAWVNHRLVRVDVETGCAEVAGFEGFRQRLFSDHVTA